MIADNMPFRFHSFDQIFVFRNEISNHKKCSRCLMFFQCIQNSRSISIFKACVKGEIDFLFFGIFSKKGIVLSQFFYRCISNRTFAFFLKTESPVGTLGRSSSLQEYAASMPPSPASLSPPDVRLQLFFLTVPVLSYPQATLKPSAKNPPPCGEGFFVFSNTLCAFNICILS